MVGPEVFKHGGGAMEEASVYGDCRDEKEFVSRMEGGRSRKGG